MTFRKDGKEPDNERSLSRSAASAALTSSGEITNYGAINSSQTSSSSSLIAISLFNDSFASTSSRNHSEPSWKSINAQLKRCREQLITKIPIAEPLLAMRQFICEIDDMPEADYYSWFDNMVNHASRDDKCAWFIGLPIALATILFSGFWACWELSILLAKAGSTYEADRHHSIIAMIISGVLFLGTIGLMFRYIKSNYFCRDKNNCTFPDEDNQQPKIYRNEETGASYYIREIAIHERDYKKLHSRFMLPKHRALLQKTEKYRLPRYSELLKKIETELSYEVLEIEFPKLLKGNDLRNIGEIRDRLNDVLYDLSIIRGYPLIQELSELEQQINKMKMLSRRGNGWQAEQCGLIISDIEARTTLDVQQRSKRLSKDIQRFQPSADHRVQKDIGPDFIDSTTSLLQCGEYSP